MYRCTKAEKSLGFAIRNSLSGKWGTTDGDTSGSSGWNAIQRRETDSRRAAGRFGSGGDFVPALSPPAVSDGSACSWQCRRCGRRVAGWIAFRVSEPEAFRGAFAVFDLAYAHRDQRGV